MTKDESGRGQKSRKNVDVLYGWFLNTYNELDLISVIINKHKENKQVAFYHHLFGLTRFDLFALHVILTFSVAIWNTKKPYSFNKHLFTRCNK